MEASVAGDRQLMTRTVALTGYAVFFGLLASGVFMVGPAFAEGVPAQTTYASPDDAVAGLVAAVQNGEPKTIIRILGPGSERLVVSGDAVKDAALGRAFLEAEAAKHSLASDGPDQMTLVVGANDWPMPIPIVRTDGSWHFDSKSGAEEMVDRRIGQNEIAAIQFCLAYIDAQNYYFSLFKEADGSGVYAQHFASTPGNYDGLYWPSEPDVPESPLTPLVNVAVEEGYSGQLEVGKRVPFRGYDFKVLTQQGPDAPSGARAYLQGGRMTGGFALIAWPTSYGASGVMSFMTSKDGHVFQKNLGPRTGEVAESATSFNPDLSWTRVNLVETH
jgi:hypothetical protein